MKMNNTKNQLTQNILALPADGDIKKQTEYYNEKTGEKIIVNLCRPRLRDGAIPSKFPNCPSYMTSATCLRESPNAKRERLEIRISNWQFGASLKSKELNDSKNEFSSFPQLLKLLEDIRSTSFQYDKFLPSDIHPPPIQRVKVQLMIEDGQFDDAL